MGIYEGEEEVLASTADYSHFARRITYRLLQWVGSCAIYIHVVLGDGYGEWN